MQVTFTLGSRHDSPINKGCPVRILSSLDIRLTAPALVRGGKNSSEKNLSLDSIRALIFSPSVASYYGFSILTLIHLKRVFN